MKRLLSIIFSVMLGASFSSQADAQSLMQTAKKAEQRAKELKQQETSRYNAIVESKDLSKYNQFINDYPRGSKTPEIRKRAEEVKLWNDATNQNTIASYEDYLERSKYHWYNIEAINIIRFLRQQAWDRVAAINTIPAYQQYLQENPTSVYRRAAENAINRIHGAAEWQRIKDSTDTTEIQDFIKFFPHASETSIATIRLHELKGLQHYNNGDFAAAFSELIQISRDNVSYANRKAYDDVMEYYSFSKLGELSSEAALMNFMRRYPNSKYSTQVNNMIAVAKARNLDSHASSHDYEQALSYAKDSDTRNIVKSYISMNKKKQKERRKAMMSWKREQNGGTFNFGLDFMDMGYNCESDDGTIFYYNLGLLLKIGNYMDWVQFAFGIKPGLIGYDDINYSSYYEMETGFHMPIIGQLKLNLFRTSEDSRFFAYGQYQYNAVRIKDVESEMSWAVGLGIGWKHFDCSLYYRQDMGKSYDKQHYIGVSLIYYWQL